MLLGSRCMIVVCAVTLVAMPVAGEAPEAVRQSGSAFPEGPITGPLDAGTTASVGAPISASLGLHRAGSKPGGPSSLVPGTAAIAGDYLLQNDRITVAISDAKHASGNAISGGYIIDGYLNDRPVDSLGQLHLYLDNTYPRMARFEGVVPLFDTKSGTTVLQAFGVDSQDPTIKVWSIYTLRKGSNVVEIETGVTPTRTPLVDFRIGDAFAWGSTQQFLPDLGFETSGRFFQSGWVGGLGRGVAYGYFAEGGTDMSGPMGSTWIDPNVTTGTAQVGETITSRRRFAVAHDLAEIYHAYLDEAGTSYTALSGTIRETENDAPAAGVRVNITRPDGTSVTQALSRPDGKFTVWLPAGAYMITPTDIIRTATTPAAAVTLPDDDGREIEFKVASPAVASFRVTDEATGELMPCKVRFFGIGGTMDPDMGPPHEIRTRNVVYLTTGEERLALPAGDYNVVVSHGIEYHVTSVTVSLKRNRETRMDLSLKRAFQPKGMISGDFHQHMKNSFDSAISLEDRVISSVGEGLQYIVATDHNYVTDLEPVIRRLGMQDRIRSAIGNEITTREHFFGHFNVFPLMAQPGQPGNGATPYEKVTAQQLMGSARLGITSVLPPNATYGHHREQQEKVLQINHPRSGDIGYFDRIQLDPNDATTTHPTWSDNFTAIEVFNGKRTDQFEEVFRDWANLLNLGYTFTATGNSDSHKVYDQEAGYPRNYVAMGKEWSGRMSDVTPQAVVEAVNRRHGVLITNGPFVTFQTKRGAPVGAMETKKSGKLEFDVKVEGADFVQPSSITFYGNGKAIRTVEFAETAESLKWQGTLDDEPTTDTWYTVVVRGSKSMFPVVNPLIEGRLTVEPVPLAFTNPIWIDRDGDGRFSAINADKFPMMNEDRGPEALRRLDELTTQSKQRRLPRSKTVPGES